MEGTTIQCQWWWVRKRLKPDVNNEFQTREGWGLVMNNFSQMYA